MHRRLVKRLLAAAAGEKKRSLLAPCIIGLGIWIGFPTMTGYQDMTSLISGLETSNARWNSYVQKSVAGSVHAAEMPFIDGDAITGSISGSGVNLPGVGTVAFRGKAGVMAKTPDEARVVRTDKTDRVLQVTPVAPPKNFSAGSIFERTSSLLRPAMDDGLKMAFAKSAIKGKEIQIAAAFHAREEEKSSGVPTALVALITNEQADVLATAYAPAEPDYAKASPFETLLQDENPDSGRFIPPLAKGDHAWMQTALPAAVFSKPEQTCLANAIYFEARGESLRGQAAVAQVVLNRVRNPAYPGSVCGVVYQNSHWRNACQFSFACDGIKDRITEPSRYSTAKDVALAVSAGKIFIPEVGSSTHYYANYVNPGWARSMHKMVKIGLHIFYRTYGGGWS